jgi:tetratricopeptide (TPR) repeat protein
VRTGTVITLAAAALLLFSCGVSRKAQSLARGDVSATLKLRDEEPLLPEMEALRSHRRDTIRVTGLNGEEMFLMNAVQDENGEMVAHDVIDAAVVTARFRNVAERHGKVDLEFQIIVPEAMQDSKWQLRFFPDMYVLGDSIRLEPVVITGRDYRKAQLKGYQQYERFLASIVSDTTRFINVWQLELFLQRNIPEVYGFRSDSTEVSDEQFASVYGVTERLAVDHYTNKIAKRWNNRKKSLRDRMYRKYVKVPIVTEGIRLDTVLRDVNGDFIYNYVQTISTRPKLRKVDIVLSGEVWESDRKVYLMSRSEPLTFYISSLSSFVDGKERYLTRIIERRAQANTACYVDFASGSSEVDISLSNNRDEIGRIRGNLAQLIEDTVYDLDSIVVTASASPEGSARANRSLAQRRSESVCRFFEGYIRHYRDSLDREAGFSIGEDGEVVHKVHRPDIRFIARNGGENWKMLDALIRKDSTVTDAQKEEYASLRASAVDVDALEEGLRRQPYYRYLREQVYPRLRTVRFDFHLHRKGMVKDTVHTTELDTTYMLGVQAIRDRDYERAVSYLRTYADYNTAVAYCALDYNASALSILETLEPTAEVLYMRAVVYTRLGRVQEAVQCYVNSCELNPAYIHRGNLDPEIAALIKTYDLNRQNDSDYDY